MSKTWAVYYLETGDGKIELFYRDEDDARAVAVLVTKTGTATISRMTIRVPVEMQDFAGAMAMLKCSGVAKSADVLATYKDGKEVPE